MPLPHGDAVALTHDRRVTSLVARWVFPVVGPPLRDGFVTIDGERIVAVGRHAPDGSSIVDLGAVALLPGLVNTHTHLEFSNCAEPLGEPGTEFAHWIGAVTQKRVASSPDATREAIARGLRESLTAGTTLIGEIATSPLSAEQLRLHPLGSTAFWEVICLAPARFDEVLARVDAHLNQPTATQPVQLGISPHAPYTVHPELFARLVEIATQNRLPLAFHLAESPAELELMRAGTGPMVDYLSGRGFWLPDAIAQGTRPLDYLRQLSRADRALVIHGNYLDDEEIAFVGERADRMAIVYCPRTHAYFGHKPYPLQKLLAAGALVALGTDSRASNPDLSLLAEMRFVARNHAAVAPDVILRLGTLDGARALGRADVAGSLEPGKRADLVAVPLPDFNPADPHELLFATDLKPIGTMIAGAWVGTASHQLEMPR